jgi:hypothetical protein
LCPPDMSSSCRLTPSGDPLQTVRGTVTLCVTPNSSGDRAADTLVGQPELLPLTIRTLGSVTSKPIVAMVLVPGVQCLTRRPPAAQAASPSRRNQSRNTQYR